MKEKTTSDVQQTKSTKDMTLKQKIIRSSLVILIVCVLFAALFCVLYFTGAWDFLRNREKVQNWIASLKFWGLFIFVLLQFLQVTFLPLPSTITTLAGVYVFGPLRAALLSFAGIMLGSIFAFFLGRVFGRKLVDFMVGKETCEKWTKFLTDAKYSFVVMMILPVFPDDVLCLVAGLTDMSWAFFVITNIISRPLAIFTTCYLGSGELIPYHGWGLGVWAALIVVVAVLIYLSYRYREQIENFMQKTFKTKKTKTEISQIQSEENASEDKPLKPDVKKMQTVKTQTNSKPKTKKEAKPPAEKSEKKKKD